MHKQYYAMLMLCYTNYIVCFVNMQVRYVKDVEERKKILEACHSDTMSGHLGLKKTITRINQRVFWPGLVKDVHELVCL